MAESKLFVGDVEVLALTDNAGDFPIPLSQLFPGVQADAWVPFRQRYPEVFSGPDTWHNHYGCYLLRSQGRTILVDTGLGSKATNPGAVQMFGGGHRWTAPGRTERRRCPARGGGHRLLHALASRPCRREPE